MNEKSLRKQARIDYIDLFRALGIILMIIGHVGLGNHFDKWIHIFHMPMFFVISGYFWKDQPFLSMLKKKARTLLIPYFVFGLFHLVIQFIRIGHIDTHGFYLLFLENTTELGVPIAGALWFLTAMFFSEILFWCVQRIKNSFSWIASIIIAVSGIACARYLPFRLPLALDAGMVGVGFYQIGKVLKEKLNKWLNASIMMTLIGIASFSIIGMLNGYVNLRLGCYGLWILFGVASIGMTVSLWNFSRHIYKWMNSQKRFRILLTWLCSVGSDSIIYLCLNQLCILVNSILIVKAIALPEGAVYTVLKTIVIFVMTMIELYFAQRVITKTKLKFVVGR